MEDTSVNPAKLIADYVIAIRSRGAFLAYSDYAIISTWLELAKNTDKLLLVLDDILPLAFSRIPKDSPPPTLKMVNRRVIRALTESPC